ncbi:MAG: dihydrofolate reductase family protein [Desulfobacterales bacterium]|jgi:dihydrofolate reductase
MKTILMVAQSLDGKIARHPNHFPDWTGKADKRLFVEVTRRAGVMIMGSKTFDTLGRPLPGRHHVIMSRDRSRRSQWENLVFSDASPTDILKTLEEQGFTEAVLAGGATINSLFEKAGLIDEVMITITPHVFGKGISLFNHELSMDLALLEMKAIGEDRVLLHYRVRV